MRTDFDTYWSEFDHAEHEDLSRPRCWVCDEPERDCTPTDHERADAELRERMARRES